MVQHQSGTLNDLENSQPIGDIKVVDSLEVVEAVVQTTDALGEQLPEVVAEELQGISEAKDNVILVHPDDIITPDVDSNDWMSKLREDEVFNTDRGTAPRLHGLRRLARPFIQEEESKVNALIVVPRDDTRTFITKNGDGEPMSKSEVPWTRHLPMASVTFNIKLKDGRKFSDSADAYFLNCDQLGLFPTAVASARAEARCLRKVLGINEHAAEEMTDKDAQEELAPDDGAPIKPEQSKLIDAMLQKSTLSLKDLLEQITTRDIHSVEELTVGEATKALRILNNQKKKDKRKKAKKS